MNNQQNSKARTENTLIRIISINILILVGFLSIVLVATEIYLKTTIPSTKGGSIFSYTLDTKRYKVMKKDHSITAWGKELRTNELGFRDNKTSVPVKQPDEFRIIVLGDSFTVSAGVDFDSIYTTLLEKKLQQEYKNVEVMNLAVAGYNIIEYEMVLNEVALDLQPDLLLVSVFPTNDFSLKTSDNNYLVASGQSKKLEKPWYKELYVYRAFLWRVVTKLEVLFKTKEDGVASNSNNEHERGWKENLSALGRIIEKGREKDLPVVVTLLPNTWSYELQHKETDRIKAFLAEYDAEPFALLYPFIESGVSEPNLRVNLLDSHPNVQYNSLVAEYLTPYLAKKISESNSHQ